MMVELKLETAQALLNYLISRPYSEVYQGIPELNEAIKKAQSNEPKPE
jgi:hypothetical protein